MNAFMHPGKHIEYSRDESTDVFRGFPICANRRGVLHERRDFKANARSLRRARNAAAAWEGMARPSRTVRIRGLLIND
jgi:hypothetical protein